MSEPNDDAETGAPAFDPTETEATRGRMQGLGVGQREMDAQRDPDRIRSATTTDSAAEPRSFDGDLEGPTNSDRPSQADFGDTDIASRDGASE